MIDGTVPSTAEVQDLVDEWFHCLDVHAPVERLRAMLADNGLEMRFPEETLRSLEGFGRWYDGVTRQYFDEVHTLETIAVRQECLDAIASIRVRWEASVWNPPDAKSQRLAYDADQTWRLRRVPAEQRVVITTYIVDALTPVADRDRLNGISSWTRLLDRQSPLTCGIVTCGSRTERSASSSRATSPSRKSSITTSTGFRPRELRGDVG